MLLKNVKVLRPKTTKIQKRNDDLTSFFTYVVLLLSAQHGKRCVSCSKILVCYFSNVYALYFRTYNPICKMQFLHYIHINLIWICRKPWIFLDFCTIMETTF